MTGEEERWLVRGVVVTVTVLGTKREPRELRGGMSSLSHSVLVSNQQCWTARCTNERLFTRDAITKDNDPAGTTTTFLSAGDLPSFQLNSRSCSSAYSRASAAGHRNKGSKPMYIQLSC